MKLASYTEGPLLRGLRGVDFTDTDQQGQVLRIDIEENLKFMTV
jgi:hypothetical protein